MQKYLANVMDRGSAFLVAHPRVSVGGQWALAGIGALYVSSKVLSFVYHFLKVFLIGGTNVGCRDETPDTVNPC